MSRGLGKMQALIMDTLRGSRVPMSAAELRNEYLENLWLDVPDDDRDFSVWNTPSRQRSIRMSMGRALRQLEASGQIKRDKAGNWYPFKDGRVAIAPNANGQKRPTTKRRTPSLACKGNFR
jgi:hypothetical protein